MRDDEKSDKNAEGSYVTCLSDLGLPKFSSVQFTPPFCLNHELNHLGFA